MPALGIFVLGALLAKTPDGEVWTPPLPVAEPPTEPRAPRDGQPEILYVNFDGAVLQSGCGNDAHYDCSTLADLFDGYVGPFNGNETQRMAILQATRKAVADFGIRVLVDRPPDDVDYTMVIYGDLGEQSFAGVAPYIDCEDLRPGETSFTQGFDSSNIGSTVILQEAAHTWGLEHVDGEFDILNPFKSAGIHQSFVDECLKIVANTDLEPTAGACNQVHTDHCDAGYQNSYREMKTLFGDPIPDIVAPSVEVVSPADGSTFVLPTTISLRTEIEDDLHPQFYEIEIFDGDASIYEDIDVGVDLLLVNPPAGDYDLRIAIRDEGGNPAETTVHFTVLPEGSEVPEDEHGDGPEATEEGGCRIGARPPLTVLLLLGWALHRRRRPR